MLLLFPASVVVIVMVVAIRSKLGVMDALANTGIALCVFVLFGFILFSTGWFGHKLVPSMAFASLGAAVVAVTLAVLAIRLVFVPAPAAEKDETPE